MSVNPLLVAAALIAPTCEGLNFPNTALPNPSPSSANAASTASVGGREGARERGRDGSRSPLRRRGRRGILPTLSNALISRMEETREVR